MKNEVFTIGADPEICLVDKDGNLRSAIGLIAGTKLRPQPLSNGGNVQRDNVAMEFGIIPATTCRDFVENIKETMSLAFKELPEGFGAFKCASVNFPESELANAEAKKFGCDPDYNAWEMGEITCKGEDKRADGTLRSFGGHIHIGYVPNSGNDFLKVATGRWSMIQAMDILLGIRSLILDNMPGSQKRRELYGKAGCHRPCPYGVEYRVLSNFWIFDDKIMSELYDLCCYALRIVREDKLFDLFAAVNPEDVLNAIDNGDVKLAKAVWVKVKRFIKNLK